MSELKRQTQRKARVLSFDAAVDAHVSIKTAVAGELPAVWGKRRKRRRKSESIRGAEPIVNDSAVPRHARLGNGEWIVQPRVAR